MIELRALGQVCASNAPGLEMHKLLVHQKQVALVSYLASAGPAEMHRRDVLLALFWPDLDEHHARGALRQILHGLRENLGQHVIVRRGTEEVGLNRNEIWCDVWAFRKAAKEGRLEDAAELYGGRFLDGFHLAGVPEFERWQEREAEKLGSQYEDAVSELAEKAEADGDLERATMWWERAVEHDPFNSQYVQRLMSVLMALGYRVRAIRAAERYAVGMRRDLGVEPSHETVALLEELRGDVAADDVERGLESAAGLQSSHEVAIEQPIDVGAPQASSGKSRRAGIVALLRMPRTTIGIVVGIVAAVVSVLIVAIAIVESSNRRLRVNKPQLALLLTDGAEVVESQFLTAGIGEDIAFRLAHVSGIELVASSGRTAEGNSTLDARQLGQSTGASLVLMGSVYAEQQPLGAVGLQVRCALVRVADGARLWDAVYVRPLVEVSDIPVDIAQGVLAVLGVKLSEGENDRLVRRLSDVPAAYVAFLRGVHNIANMSHVSAADELERAVALDPDFAVAYLWLTQANLYARFTLEDVSSQRLDRARDAAEEARRLAPDLVEARFALGDYYYTTRDYRRAFEHYVGGVEIDTNDAAMLGRVGRLQRRWGDFESANALLRRAVLLQPHNIRYREALARALAVQHKFGESAQVLDSTPDTSSLSAIALLERALIELSIQGDIDGAREWIGRASELYGIEALCTAGIGPLATHLRPLRRILFDECAEEAYLLSSQNRRARLEGVGTDSGSLYLAMAELSHQANRLRESRAYYDSARVTFEAKANRWPHEAVYHRELGLAYAGLGRRDDALREGFLAMELMPEVKDAVAASAAVATMARICVMIGDYDGALNQLSHLLTMPSWASTHVLRLDPAWIGLRTDPLFRQLVAGN